MRHVGRRYGHVPPALQVVQVGGLAHRGSVWQFHCSAMADDPPDIPTVVIPYRNRKMHLDCVLTRFQHLKVVVVEQCDAHPFNRGALLNIGYCKAREQGAARVLLHDCDLVPDDTLLRMYLEPWPMPIVHFGARFRRYNNAKKYFGGVHGFSAGDFPGYPNHFWGWGGEDDALRDRVNLRNATYARQGEYLDLEGHATARDKLQTLRPQDKCVDRWEKLSTDRAMYDNHRHNTLEKEVRWEQVTDRLAWGCITLRRTE